MAGAHIYNHGGTLFLIIYLFSIMAGSHRADHGRTAPVSRQCHIFARTRRGEHLASVVQARHSGDSPACSQGMNRDLGVCESVTRAVPAMGASWSTALHVAITPGFTQHCLVFIDYPRRASMGKLAPWFISGNKFDRASQD